MAIQVSEQTFTLRNGIVITGKLWKNSNSRPRACRRFLGMHGFLDNANSYDLLAPLLLEQLGPEPVEFLALDFAGHGKSSHRTTESYSFWRYTEDCWQVVEQMGWQKYAVIGHSMGGGVATVYTGTFPENVVLCIVLDNFGPYVREVDDQPDHLVEHFLEKKNLPNKKLPFHATVEAAARARSSKQGPWGLTHEAAQILIPRAIRSVERTTNDGKVESGYTWSSDQMLTIRSPQSMSEDYCKAFMRRIACPYLALLASNGFMTMLDEVEERKSWFVKTQADVRSVEGNHSVHLENAPLVARELVAWIQEKDQAEQARL